MQEEIEVSTRQETLRPRVKSLKGALINQYKLGVGSSTSEMGR